MKLELYRRSDEELRCSITAVLSGGSFTITGHDLGPLVSRVFDSDDHEYAVSLDKTNTEKLFEELGCSDASDEEKLNIIKQTFENSRADSALKEYCAERGIETSFWCWP